MACRRLDADGVIDMLSDVELMLRVRMRLESLFVLAVMINLQFLTVVMSLQVQIAIGIIKIHASLLLKAIKN